MKVYRLEPDSDLPAKLASALDVDVGKIVESDGVNVAFFRPYSAVEPTSTVLPSDRVKALFSGRLPEEPEGLAFAPSAPFNLRRQEVNRDQPARDPEEVSAFVRMDRFVGGLRVDGTGSVAIAEVRGSSITGVVTRWDKATPFPAPRPTIALSEARIREAFAAAYKNFAGFAEVVPDSPELVYVGDRKFLEPAYRLFIQIRHGELVDGMQVPDDLGTLYVPATSPMPREPGPVEQSNPGTCLNDVDSVSGIPFDLYAMFDFSADWAGSARAFRKSLHSDPAYIGRRFCYLESRTLKEDKNLFFNSVPIVHVETHGVPGYLLTANNAGVELATTGGFGVDVENGKLKLLVLHSCEVIQSFDDNNRWFETWFAVFRGLHTVVGYRTKALMDDVPAAFALHVANGRPILRSWIAEVAAFPKYAQGTVISTGDRAKPLGRPAAVTVCHHDDDTKAELADLPSPSCLVNYWLTDRPVTH
jgi:hypothetical protein